MMTIMTDVRVRPGAEDKWDAVVRDRMAAAKERPGWVGAQLLRSESQPNQRVIVGTWEHREWHEVVVDVTSGEDQLRRRSTTS
jgi:heme-degrading monooxygenase HmoA